MSEAVQMHIDSDPAHLPVVRGAVEQMCRTIGFGEVAAAKAVAAVDEALANIIQHAYDGQRGRPIEIELAPVADAENACGIEITLIDQGRVVADAEIHGRDLADIRPGGLGTHIMECCMDTIEYVHPSGGGTHLRMRKFVSAAAATGEEGQAHGR